MKLTQLVSKHSTQQLQGPIISSEQEQSVKIDKIEIMIIMKRNIQSQLRKLIGKSVELETTTVLKR